ncbi:MAG: FmdB family transcriptional regulator [Treponema sp.]|nr:MAG: FmdB family transcriptional regulator [Treponema sp.]
MPTYEYSCSSCNHNFDVFQKMSDEPTAECPKCGKKSKRVITSFCANFKGSGFYVNDSAAKSSSSECSGKSCGSCSGCSS